MSFFTIIFEILVHSQGEQTFCFMITKISTTDHALEDIFIMLKLLKFPYVARLAHLSGSGHWQHVFQGSVNSEWHLTATV